jgi:molybdopterin synthase catalytic subunit
LINTVKAEVPIWKEQHFASGDSEWVGLPAQGAVR